MRTDHLVLRLLVWNMRWMTRHLGFIARPFVAWYGEHEVIACGLRTTKGNACIIYSAVPSLHKHIFTKRSYTGTWLPDQAVLTENFSGNLVRQVKLPNAKLGNVYQARAQRKSNGRLVRSPKITIKAITNQTNILNVQLLPKGQVKFTWPGGEQFDPMVYFLALEDKNGNSLAGIYTRDTNWTYPVTKQASLSLGPADPPPLTHAWPYTAKLVVVDFDGWVSNITKRQFTMLP